MTVTVENNAVRFSDDKSSTSRISRARIIIFLVVLSTIGLLFGSAQTTKQVQNALLGGIQATEEYSEVQRPNGTAILSASYAVGRLDKAQVPIGQNISEARRDITPLLQHAIKDNKSNPPASILQTTTEHLSPISKWKNGFAACLMWADDNHHLIEWLAYHYQRLPLRRLIMCMDPTSRTTPKYILKRYTSRGLMEIDQWTEEYIFEGNHSLWIVDRTTKNGTSLLGWQKLQRHRNRQNLCMQKCFRQLKSETYQLPKPKQPDSKNETNDPANDEAVPKWTWVSSFDVDEFIGPNHEVAQKLWIPGQNSSIEEMKSSSIKTIGELLDTAKEANMSAMLSSPCVGFKRTSYSPRESQPPTPPTKDASELEKRKYYVLPNFNHSDFLTHRWIWRAKNSAKINGWGKCFIDVSRIEWSNLGSMSTVHRPVKAVCPRSNVFLSADASSFIARHYVGTMEQYGFRADPRKGLQSTRTVEAYEVNKGQAYDQDNTIYGWLYDLTNDLGESLATALLAGAGYTNHSSHWKVV